MTESPSLSPQTESFPRMDSRHVKAMENAHTSKSDGTIFRLKEISSLVSSLVSGDAVVVNAKDWDSAKAVGRDAFDLVNWLHSPGAVSNRLLEDIAKVSGVHANNVWDLAQKFGAKQGEGEWLDEPSWLSLDSTREEK